MPRCRRTRRSTGQQNRALPNSEPDVYPWKLAHTNYSEVKKRRYEVAVILIGATEEHNLHLPYSIDAIQATTIAEKCLILPATTLS